MVTFFFNELSIHDQFKNDDQFYQALQEFRDYKKIITGEGYRFYVHRNIRNRPVCGETFRAVVSSRCDKNQKRVIMNLIDREGWFLPDNSELAEGDTLYCNGNDATESALGECAYRKILNMEEPLCTSISGSDYEQDSLRVTYTFKDSCQGVNINNFYSQKNLKIILKEKRKPIQSWQILCERIALLPNICLEDYVLDKLCTNPFAINIAGEIYIRLQNLSEMITAKNKKEFDELYIKYCTGRKSHFSDSSSNEKNNYKEELSFYIDGKKIMCPFHGKVKMQQYRIHIFDSPAWNKTARIVYIGPKLTKK